MKRKLLFGRMCVAMMAATCVLSANAQVVVHEGDYRDALVVPSALTVDGKARITLGSRSREISIYNKNFEKEASIIPASQSYSNDRYIQEATVNVTGAALISKDPFQDATKYNWYNPETSTFEPVSATSLEEGLEKLKSIESSYNYTIYNIGSYSFIFGAGAFPRYFESSLFGTQYPVSGNFYVCQDGYLYSVNTELKYELLYNESGAVWTTTQEIHGTVEKGASVAGCRHVNADTYSQIAHSDNDEQLVCTQNFFNDDEEWEYLQYTYGDNEIVSAPTVKQRNTDGTVTLSRTISLDDSRTGIRVLNQSGNVILSMSFPTPIVDSGELDLWTVNGKSYIQIVRNGGSGLIIEFYEIEKGTSNVRKVLEQEVPAEEMSEDTTIYDLSGRVLTEKPATGVYIQGGKKYLAQ